MSILQKAVNQMSRLKAGIQGGAGSGKTRTAAELAIGLAKIHKKPVAFCDSESGTDYLIPLFEKNGVELLRVKTKSFADLCTFMVDAEKDGMCCVVIDSITAYWIDLGRTYKTEKARRLLEKKEWFLKMSPEKQAERVEADARNMRLSMQDWGPIKETWGKFSALYLDSQMHAIVCGRLGFDWDFREDEEGHKELIKTGTKMKTEGEMAYEPSLLLEMTIIKPLPDAVKAGASSLWIHRCTILKDRTDLMNGAVLDNPTFDSFAPIIGFLNPNGPHVAIEPQQTGGNLFGDSGESAAREYARKCEIAAEEIKESLVLADLDGTSGEAKKKRAELLRECFGTSAWTAITSAKLDVLTAGLAAMRAKLGQQEPAKPKLVALPGGAESTATVPQDQLPASY